MLKKIVLQALLVLMCVQATIMYSNLKQSSLVLAVRLTSLNRVQSVKVQVVYGMHHGLQVLLMHYSLKLALR
jgi:hypothetical protein